MTLFHFRLRPGSPIFDQVVYAAKKTIISGELRPGQAFPSVRVLAAGLKIHPNTVHKVVQHLIQEGLLRVRPGIGTVVAELPEARTAEKRRLLQQEVEALVLEAKRLGLQITEVIDAVEAHWARLEQPVEVGRR